MALNLTFITTTSSNLDKENTKLMRGHVTRENFRQRRDRKAMKNGRRPPEIDIFKPVDEGYDKTLPGRGTILQRRLDSTPPSPIAEFSQQYDPGLISYVIQITRPFLLQSIDGKPEERAWLDLIFTDSAVLEASLCVAETQRSLVQRGAVDYVSVGRYKRNAIKMIGERLNDPIISEGTLNAVLALAYSEQLVNNKDAWKTHLKGFIQMVRVRDSGLQPAMGHFSLSDVFGAISGLSDPQPLDQSTMTDLPPDFAFMIIESAIRDNFFAVLRAIFQIQQTIQSTYHGDKAKRDQTVIDNQIRVIQSQLITLSIKATYNKPICISLMVFLLLVRSQSQANSAVLEELAARTKEYLESVIEVRFCNAVDLIFWTLSIGGIASSKPSTRHWFLITLKTLLPALHLRSLDEAKKVLERFFWIDHVISDQFRDFWNELQRM